MAAHADPRDAVHTLPSTEPAMQFVPRSPVSTRMPLARPRRMPKARSSYPTLSLVRLGRSPLQKLAWIFGFGR
jgi:hypothetical protein